MTETKTLYRIKQDGNVIVQTYRSYADARLAFNMACWFRGLQTYKLELVRETWGLLPTGEFELEAEDVVDSYGYPA